MSRSRTARTTRTARAAVPAGAAALLAVATLAVVGPAAAIPRPEPGPAVAGVPVEHRADLGAPVAGRPCFRTPHGWHDSDVGPVPRC